MDSLAIIRRIHQNYIRFCFLDPLRQCKAASLYNVRIAIRVNEHIRCSKAIHIFIKLDTENLVLFHFFLLSSSSAVIQRLSHCSYKERATSAARIEYDRMLIYARYFCHKICNVVRCEGLVFIRLANIFVKCDKEQIQ